MIVREIDANITVNGFELGTVEEYNTYQWLFNGTAISGATGSNYIVTQNGEYRVVVTNEYDCVDTSDVYAITNVAIKSIGELARQISIYPNPATEVINITAPEEVNVIITALDGKVIKQYSNATAIPVRDISNGIYLLYVTDRNNQTIKAEKFVKTAQ